MLIEAGEQSKPAAPEGTADEKVAQNGAGDDAYEAFSDLEPPRAEGPRYPDLPRLLEDAF